MKPGFTLRKIAVIFLLISLVLFTGPVVSLVAMQSPELDYNRFHSLDLQLLDPEFQSEPIIQVYAARTW